MSLSVFSDDKTRAELGVFIKGFADLEGTEVVQIQASAGPSGSAIYALLIKGAAALVAQVIVRFVVAGKRRLTLETWEGADGTKTTKMDLSNQPDDLTERLVATAFAATIGPAEVPAEIPDKVIEGFAQKADKPPQAKPK